MLIDKITHENAVLERLKFCARSEVSTPGQRSLVDETLGTDLPTVAVEIEPAQASTAPKADKQQPKRAPLTSHLPRCDVHHEPATTTCGCSEPLKRIGEDVQRSWTRVFSVERHIRGKGAFASCEKLIQAPVPA